jgi:hypothetical protein
MFDWSFLGQGRWKFLPCEAWWVGKGNLHAQAETGGKSVSIYIV